MAVAASSAGIKAFAACSTVLFAKIFATLTIQGGKAFAAGMRSPEDARFNKDGMPKQTYGLVEDAPSDAAAAAKLAKAREIDHRWRRIVQNDLETIPIGLAVFLGSILVGGHEAANVALLSAFTLARIGHTIAYANEKQPHRAILWTAGQTFVLASGLVGVVSMIW